MPRVSIILPTYNRLDRLQRVLAALEQQTYPRDDFEVIVISDGSTDGTNAYLQHLDTPLQVTSVLQENQGVAVARNHGLAQARGEITLFVDDDVVPSPQLLVEHLRIHDEQGEGVVVLGPMLTPNDFDMKPWVRWEQAMLLKQYGDMLAGRWEPTARQFYTGNTSLLRRHILAAGGFDPAFRRAEDVELAYRLADRGLHFVFNPQAISYHYAERSFGSWLAIAYVYGRNDVVFTRDKGQSWLLPAVMREYWLRHGLVRSLAHLCLGHSMLSQSVTAMMKGLGLLGNRLGLEALSRYAYSGIFNLRYYQGMADELGGTDAFWRQVNQIGREAGLTASRGSTV